MSSIRRIIFPSSSSASVSIAPTRFANSFRFSDGAFTSSTAVLAPAAIRSASAV